MSAYERVAVSVENWRAERAHYAEVFENQELPAVAERLREVGLGEHYGVVGIDEMFCAKSVAAILWSSSRLLVCVEDVGYNAGCADPFDAWRGGFPVCDKHRDRYDWDVSVSALLAEQPEEQWS